MTTMTIDRERLMTQRAFGMRVLVGRERRVSLPLARGRSRGLLLHRSFKGNSMAIRVKAKAGLLAT